MIVTLLAFALLFIGTVWFWWKFTKYSKQEWSEYHAIDLQHFGKRRNFNGLEMYGGDQELVTRVEKELIKTDKDK